MDLYRCGTDGTHATVPVWYQCKGLFREEEAERALGTVRSSARERILARRDGGLHGARLFRRRARWRSRRVPRYPSGSCMRCSATSKRCSPRVSRSRRTHAVANRLPPPRNREELVALLSRLGATVLREVAILGRWLSFDSQSWSRNVRRRWPSTLETARQLIRTAMNNIVVQAQSAGLTRAGDPTEMAACYLALLRSDGELVAADARRRARPKSITESKRSHRGFSSAYFAPSSLHVGRKASRPRTTSRSYTMSAIDVARPIPHTTIQS